MKTRRNLTDKETWSVEKTYCEQKYIFQRWIMIILEMGFGVLYVAGTLKW